MGAKASGCQNDRDSNEPNTRYGSFAGQPAKYFSSTGKSAETDVLKGRHGLSERQMAPRRPGNAAGAEMKRATVRPE